MWNGNGECFSASNDVEMDGLSSLGHDVDHVAGAGAFAVPNRDEGVGVAGHLDVAEGAGFFSVLFPVGGEGFKRNALPSAASEG